jgi:Holliday junction resolvasome RuvABC ATP-dependent DNA helicase subunit
MLYTEIDNRADGVVTRDVAKAALAVYDVDELGLDPFRRRRFIRACWT